MAHLHGQVLSDGRQEFELAPADMAAQALEVVLRNCGDNLTRENVMKQAAGMKDVQGDLSLPG